MPALVYKKAFPQRTIYGVERHGGNLVAQVNSNLADHVMGWTSEIYSVVLDSRACPNILEYHCSMYNHAYPSPAHAELIHLCFSISFALHPQGKHVDSIIGLCTSLRNHLERIPPHCQECYDHTYLIMTVKYDWSGAPILTVCGQTFSDLKTVVQTEFDAIARALFNLANIAVVIRPSLACRLYPEQSVFLTPRSSFIPRTFTFRERTINDDGDLETGLPFASYYY